MIKQLNFSAILVLLFGLFTSLMTDNLYAQNTGSTLTQEQINEVEKNPIDILSGCNSRVDSRLDAGNLCDSFSTYLDDKCKRLDNIPDYCGVVGVYLPKRVIQKDCISNPPLETDVKRSERCVDYIPIDFPIPLNFKVEIEKGSLSTEVTFSVHNPNPHVVTVRDISYNIARNGENWGSGEINYGNAEFLDCTSYCFDIDAKSTRTFKSSLPRLNSTSSDYPYIIDFVYKYENPDSTTVTKSFNFTTQ